MLMKKKKEFRFFWEEPCMRDPSINIGVPGFRKDEIQVSIEHGFITVKASKKNHKEEKGKNFYREEVFSSAFSRSMSLPPQLQAKDIGIKVDDGSVKIVRKKKKKISKENY